MADYEGIGPLMDSYDASVQLHPKHKEEKQSVAEGLAATKFVLADKQALANLLKLWVVDVQSRGQRVNLDSNEEIVRLIPILCGYFSREELVELVGENMQARFLKMYRAEMLQSLLLEHELQHILHAFNQAHIPIILLKGPVLAHTVYPEVHLRTYHDFDILIQPQDLTRAHDLLVSMGYANYEEFLADAIDSKRASYNFALKHSGSWLEVLIELHTAPHPGQGGVMFEPEAIWAGAQQITILDEPVLTMGVIDHLLYLCWHYRFHGFTRLNWLFDIVQLLRASEAEIDWNALVQTARRLRLATHLYYCLLWCRNIFGVLDAEQFKPIWEARNPQPGQLFTIGTMFWLPNSEGVAWWLREGYGQLQARCPDITYDIVGARPPRALQLLASRYKGVHVHGYVADVVSFWTNASLLAVPLLSGGGVRVKILEAMAMGVAVVSTSIGCEGLAVRDQEHLLIADTPEAFVRACASVLRDKELAHSSR